ncbi:Kinesin light chain [Seminavis robusta]|uniref:Kinesin light chain n=1 Tax=Seminavis robusta TaxID=568900 RepID=A0A9N8ERK1_9STRA|nr:Kinesin light chain [Seminavis robusta]|eukprot:Sro1487_g276780.1 Kinesin light chain (608) ;mRNA; r:15731-17659
MERSTLAVSVHYLRSTFLQEVLATPGLSRDSTVYDIENLDEEAPGVIRRKADHVCCPIDGRMGAAYVHGVDDDGISVGQANVMLSYTWGYRIGDIIDTLVDFCYTTNRDPTQTFVWICFLCVNQHRVWQQKKSERSGMLEPQVDFFAEFGLRVVSIGHVLAMMSPWNNPRYLQRIWSVYELYTAHVKDCQTTVVMPPSEKQALQQDLLGNDNDNHQEGLQSLYKALGQTQIENALASIERDRVVILELVAKQCGFKVMNQKVNELLRSWIRHTVCRLSQSRRELYSCTTSDSSNVDGLHHANQHDKLGVLMLENGEHGPAMDEFQYVLAIRQDVLGDSHPDVAAARNRIAWCLMRTGANKAALVELRKATAASQSGHRNADVAWMHHNIGRLLREEGDYEGALEEHQTALSIREAVLGYQHSDVAASHNNIGKILQDQGDFDGALVAYRKGLSIRQQALGNDNHPDIACSHHSIGMLLRDRGDYEESWQEHQKALAIRELVRGRDHPDTAKSYTSLGKLLEKRGDYRGALDFFKIAAEIAIRVELKPAYHAETIIDVAATLEKMGDREAALHHFRQALHIQESLPGVDHAEVRLLQNKIDELLVAIP